MKVLLVNTYDGGGAANACRRLHLALLNNDVESKILVREKQYNWPLMNTFERRPITIKVYQKIQRRFRNILFELQSEKRRKRLKHQKFDDFVLKRSKNLEMFSYPISDYDITESELYKQADIINLHWVANFLDYKSFFEKNKKPVVWTLHDMNPFTGGEHYTEEIVGVDKNGFPVLRTLTNEEVIEFESVLNYKKEVFKNVDNIYIVSLCDWMTTMVEQSQLFSRFPVTKIPNSLDTNIFKPRDSSFSRDLLGLPQDKVIILFVADSITNNRKGFSFLLKAFEQLQNEDVVLCAVGKSNADLKAIRGVIELGSISNEGLMSAVYSASDVFVIPSVMDNLPNTVVESLCCGTPVVGFPVGGIVDMVENDKNGYLTEGISVQHLKAGIDRFLRNKDTFHREAISKKAHIDFSPARQSASYIELFENILKSSKS